MLGDIQQSRAALLIAVYVGMVQNILSKSTKYALFDPTKEMAYIPLDKESKASARHYGFMELFSMLSYMALSMVRFGACDISEFRVLPRTREAKSLKQQLNECRVLSRLRVLALLWGYCVT